MGKPSGMVPLCPALWLLSSGGSGVADGPGTNVGALGARGLPPCLAVSDGGGSKGSLSNKGNSDV